MAGQDELQEFRKQLQDVKFIVEAMSKRLEDLESEYRAAENQKQPSPKKRVKTLIPPKLTPTKEALQEPDKVESAFQRGEKLLNAQTEPASNLAHTSEGSRSSAHPQDSSTAKQTSKSLDKVNLEPASESSLERTLGADSLVSFIRKTVIFINPKEKMGWEMALGTYWLPRIAVIVLAIGMTWLTTLAIKKFGGPYMAHIRVLVGYGICAALYLVGRRLESRFSEYARILLASAFSMVYFITFATYYLPYTQIFSSPVPTLLAVSAIVIFWAFLAHLRKSLLLAFGMVFLGEFTISAASITSQLTHAFAPVGLFILATGGIFFMIRHGWYHLGAVTMVASNCNLTLWFFNSQSPDTVENFFIGLGLLGAHYLLFNGGDYFGVKTTRSTVSDRWRRWYVSFNSAAFFALGLLLVETSSFASSYVYLFYAGFATTLILIGYAYYQRVPIDPLFNVYFTKASALYVLALADYFEGSTLTLALTIQALLLLISARQWKLPINRILSLAVAMVALLHGIYSGIDSHEVIIGSRVYFSQIIPISLSSIMFLGLSLLYQRTDWNDQKLQLNKVPKYLHRLAWQADLLQEKPDSSSEKFFDGQLFQHLYACSASFLFLASSHVLFSEYYQATGLSIVGLLVVLAAMTMKTNSFFYASLPLSTAAIIFFHLIIKDAQITPGWTSTLLCWAPFIVLTEISRSLPIRTKTKSPSTFSAVIQGVELSTLSLVYLIATLELYFVGVWELLPEVYWVVASSLFGLAATLYAFVRKVPVFSVAAFVFLAFSGYFAFSRFNLSSTLPIMAIGILSSWATAVFSDRWFKNQKNQLCAHQSDMGPYIFYGLACWITLTYFSGYQDILSNSLVITITSVILMVLIRVLHKHALFYCASSAMIWAYISWLFAYPESSLKWHLMGISLPIIALTAARYLDWLAVLNKNIPGNSLIVLSALGVLWYLDNINIPKDWLPALITLVSHFYLGHAIFLRNKVSGLVSISISILN